MFALVVIVLSLLVTYISYLLFKKVAGTMSLRGINMISFVFFYNLLVQSLIGSVYILTTDTELNLLVDHLRHKEYTEMKVWLSVLYTMIAMPIGMIFIKKIFTRRKMSLIIEEYYNKPLTNLTSPQDSYLRIGVFLLSVLSIIAVVYTYANMSAIPILELIKGANAGKLLQVRVANQADFAGNVYFRNIFGVVLTPVLTFTFYTYYIQYRKSFYLLWFFVLLFFSLLILLYSFEKANLIELFIGFFMIRILIHGKVDYVRFYRVAIAGFVLIIGVYLMVTDKDLATIFSFQDGFPRRLFIDQISSLYRHYEIFPELQPFRGTNSLSQFFTSELLPRSGRVVMETVSPGRVKNGTGGVYNTLFIGEAWGNFGWAGLILAPFYVGMYVQTLFMILLRLPKSALAIGVLTHYSYNSTITGGINEFIYNGIFIGVIIVLVGTVFIARWCTHVTRQYRLKHG